MNRKSTALWHGLWALDRRDHYFYATKDELQDALVTSLTNGANLLKIRNQILPPLNSRHFADYLRMIDIDFVRPRLKTSAGEGFLIEGASNLTKVDIESYVSGVFLGLPNKVRQVSILKQKKLVAKSDYTCSASSPWYDFQRSVKSEGPSTVLEDTTESRVYAISNAELKSPEFKKFQIDLRNCASDFVLVFE